MQCVIAPGNLLLLNSEADDAPKALLVLVSEVYRKWEEAKFRKLFEAEGRNIQSTTNYNTRIGGPKSVLTKVTDGQAIPSPYTPPPQPQPPPPQNTPPPTPPFPDPRAKVVVAVYSYTARTDGDLSFERDDLLEIRDDTGDWWKARHQKTGKKGYIPNNYVAPIQSLEAEPWYFGEIQRPEAERVLTRPCNGHGSYLIRKHDNKGNMNIGHDWFVLSVRDGDQKKHYKIKTTDTGSFFIARRKDFLTLNELIEYYQQSADGLITNLVAPCKKDEDAPTISELSHETEGQWEIERSTLFYSKDDRLGAGQFGEVYKGLWKNKIPVAVKSLKPNSMKTEHFLEEAKLMKRIKHPKLVLLYAVVTKSEPVLIITELMKNGSLLDYLRGTGRNLELKHLVHIDSQIAQGMAFLESKNFIHRDLAARNVLVGENNIVKIADFGLSRCIDDEIYVAQVGAKFPIKWTAPEACNYNRFSTKSDVWSFGILMYEVVTYGRMPYAGMTNPEALVYVERGFRMERPSKCPEQYYDIMQQCWKKLPEQRPTFETLTWMLEDYFEEQKQYMESAE
eukprot:gene4569-5166_t